MTLCVGKPILSPPLSLSPNELKEFDPRCSSPQVVGEEAKVVWSLPGGTYDLTSISPEPIYDLRESSDSAQNALIRASYISCRNKLMSEVLKNLDTRSQAALLKTERYTLFIKCTLSDIGTDPNSPRPLLFHTKVRKLIPENLLPETMNLWKKLIELLLDRAEEEGTASSFLEFDKDYALICHKNLNLSFSLSLSKINLQTVLSGVPQTVYLKLLNEASASQKAAQVFKVQEKIYLAEGIKNPDTSFSLSDHEIFLLFSPNIETQAELLTHIERKLWDTPKKKRWTNPSAMAELIAEANKQGSASLFFSYNSSLHRMTISRRDAHTFIEEEKAPELTPEQISFLDFKKEDEPFLIQQISALYNQAIQEQPQKKITEVHKLADYWTFRLSLTDNIVSFGTDYFLGKGKSKTAYKILRLDIHRKIYVKCMGTDSCRGPRLHREAGKMQHMNHPHIVALRKYSKKSHSLQLEYCDHGNAGCFLDSPPQNLSEAFERITVVYQAALGLAYIHHNFPDKMAHMDFKPQNLFLTLMDGKLVGKVGDLNLHEEGDIATVTPFYLDLEGLLYGRENHGKIPAHQACDVWALGITLFEVLNGIKANPLPNEITTLCNPNFEERFKNGHNRLLA